MTEIPEIPESRGEDDRRIGLLISVLAILLAICGALGRKAENAVIVSRVDASNTWAYFQAKKLRGYQSETTQDLAKLFAQAAADPQKTSAATLALTYEAKVHKYEAEAEALSREAEGHTREAEQWEARANRFGLGEIFLQIGVVLCSIAILAQTGVFVVGGLVSSAIGLGFALSNLLLR